MRVYLAIAWRNIMRNKRRSFITVFAIAIGLASLVFLWALFDGLYPMMVNNLTGMFMGHIELADPRYVEKPDLDYAFTDGEAIFKALGDDPDVRCYSPRLTTFGLVSFGDNSQGAAIIGVDADLEREFGMLDEAILEGGQFLDASKPRGVCIGATLAKNVDVGLGDEILLVTSNRFNNLSYLGPLPIVGLIRTTVPDIDSRTVLIDRKYLAGEIFIDESVVYTNPDAEITNVDGIFTTVSIKAADRSRYAFFSFLPKSLQRAIAVTSEDQSYLDAMKVKFSAFLPDNVKARTWQEMAPWVDQTVESRKGFAYVILAIVLVIVIAGILNTVLMSVIERTREFGIMRALGTKSRQIFTMVSLESIMLGLVGVLIGAVLGVALTLLAGVYGLDLYSKFDSELMGQFYIFGTRLYPRLNLDNFFQVCGIVMGSVILVSLYPARKAARMEPVNAIKAMG